MIFLTKRFVNGKRNMSTIVVIPQFGGIRTMDIHKRYKQYQFLVGN